MQIPRPRPRRVPLINSIDPSNNPNNISRFQLLLLFKPCPITIRLFQTSNDALR